MAPYKLLPETATADVAFEAKAKGLNELFEQACLAASSVMVDLKTVTPAVQRTFSKQNKSLEGLLHDVLDELVYLKDAESLLFSQFSVVVSEGKTGNRAAVLVKGQAINQKTMKLRNDVKAVTWHLFSLKKDASKWVARVLLDV